MAGIVYLLCALLSFGCSILLLKGHSKNKYPLLFWSGVGFAGFALNNILLFIDVIVVPNVDLSVIRTIPALIGMILLIYGLIIDEV